MERNGIMKIKRKRRQYENKAKDRNGIMKIKGGKVKGKHKNDTKERNGKRKIRG